MFYLFYVYLFYVLFVHISCKMGWFFTAGFLVLLFYIICFFSGCHGGFISFRWVGSLLAILCGPNSLRVRDVWVTSHCSVVLLCLPLDPSSIMILSEDSYLYFSIFNAAIYYYWFDLQRRNYCYAIFIIYVWKICYFIYALCYCVISQLHEYYDANSLQLD